ncbi:MAG: ABC transporter permease subunit, partial [Candidatus Xenobia bacterium]
LFGAAVAGLAGGLYASRLNTLTFGFPQEFEGSIMFLAMIILGGLGSIRGAVLGAVLIGLVNKVLTPLLAATLPDLDKATFLLFGLTLVLMMLLRPQGLLPEET